MESDINTLSAMNLLIKYADDTKLFVVPSDSDLDLTEKFNNVIKWAAEKK